MYTRDTIHQLTYSDNWYHPLYKGGGYALEKTDLTCGCINDFNWHSNHDLGELQVKQIQHRYHGPLQDQ